MVVRSGDDYSLLVNDFAHEYGLSARKAEKLLLVIKQNLNLPVISEETFEVADDTISNFEIRNHLID